MTEGASLRSVWVGPTADRESDSPEFRLLSQLGHAVAAMSLDEAFEMLGQDSADLLILDVSGGHDREQFVDRLSDLPLTHQPRQVAVFTDQMDDYLRSLRRKGSKRLHVFLKPLHMHGLLGVLRHLEASDQVA
jgi:hypothetical protein